MPIFIGRYFCPDRTCPAHNKLLYKDGVCEVCGKELERVRYCPDCNAPGSPAQNYICYKCKRHLVDLLETPHVREETLEKEIEEERTEE